MRSLGLVVELCKRLPRDEPLLMVGYPANVELNLLQNEISVLQAAGSLMVHDVVVKSPAGQRMKELKKQGVDKGEAEAIAWLVETFDRTTRPAFVSVDVRARKHATANQVLALDMMGAIVDWVEEGLLLMETARIVEAVWDDQAQQRGRPSDYDTFDRTFSHRLAARKARLP